MSKLKAYPEYKNSGVEWIGEVPEGWKAVKSSLLFFAKKGASAAQLTKEYCAEHCGEFPVYSGQTENNGIMGNIDTFEFDSHDSAYILSTTVGAKAMSVSYLHGKFSLSQNCMIIGQINSRFPMKFFFYLFDVLFAYERRSIPDHMQPSFRMEDFYSYKILLPPLREQQAIAAFLDRETAQIDELITKKTRSIELLREKRQAMITHAVTKGLDPNAKMKDSGVEWIGEVPERWKTKRVYSLFHETTLRGGAKDSLLTVTQTQGIMPQAMYQEITGKRLSQQMSEDYSNYKQVRKNDLVYNKMRMWQGAIGVSSYDGCVSPAYITMRSKSEIAPTYWSRLFTTPLFLVEVNRGSQGICDDQNSCTFDKFREIRIPLPPLPEQQAIAAYLDRETAQIDALITKTERSIELLKEKRQALITAAVTGKIDVRELAPEVA